MNLKILEPEAPLTEKEIVAVEKKLGLSFPIEYRDFLLKVNGGHPEPSVFQITLSSGKKTSGSCIAWFLAIYDGEYENFLTFYERYKLDRNRLPLELMPIARDPFGNLICISISGPKLGSIYFWDHEAEEDVPTYKNIFFISNSFNKFIDSLTDK